ncbi:MAG: hypothetical protein ACRCTZ_14900 [Sarcina sp.]
MKFLLKINIFNGKGGFENVVISSNPKRLYHSYSYGLLPAIYDFETADDISNMIEIRLPLKEAKNVIEQLGFDYKDIKVNSVN